MHDDHALPVETFACAEWGTPNEPCAHQCVEQVFG